MTRKRIKDSVGGSAFQANLPDTETLKREILTTQRAIRARWPACSQRAGKKEEKTDG